MNNRLKVIRVRYRAHGWMTDNVRPRYECEDLTEIVKANYPIKRTWLTSNDVAPKKFNSPQ